MKARVLTIVVLLALSAAAVAQAQTDPWSNSFRFVSTGSTLEDELDLILGWYGNLDPARISSIEGNRLYTNLANIYTKGEEQFNPSDTIYNAETYLIGGKTDIFGYGQLGLIYDRNFHTTENINDEDSVHLLDNDVVNPGFDVKDTYKSHDLYRYEEGRADYYLGYARKLNDMKLGVCYLRNQNKAISYYADNYDLNYYNLVTGQLTYSEVQKDTGRYGEEWSNNYLALSVWKPLNDKMDVSLRLVLGMLGGDEYDEYDYSYSATFPGGDYYSETGTKMLDQQNSGTMFGVGGAYVYKWSDIVSTRFDLQFEHEGWKPNDGAKLDSTYSDADYTPAGSSTYHNNVYSDELAGEYSENGIHFIAMNNVKWNKAEFGIGLSVWSQGYEGTETHVETLTETEDYRDFNNPASPLSYVETSTWTETWEEKTTGSNLILMFPVGVEFNLNKSMLFRLGARHYMAYSDNTTNNILTDGGDLITTTRRNGDGSTYTTFTPNPLDEYTGFSNQGEHNYSDTYYTYGAAWKVTDNLHLDFMGFAKLTDLTNWKLSAVFKF